MRRPFPLAAGLVAALLACSAQPAVQADVPVRVGNPSAPVELTESGSSLLLPYLQTMIGPLTFDYAGITLDPGSGGSAKGISDVIAGTVTMGGSDAYLSNGQAAQDPDLLNIPVAVSAQEINYNVPAVPDLELSGGVLAAIYEGLVTRWNDAAIARLNPGVVLPDARIVPIRRAEGSGDTFIFTSLLSATSDDWRSGPAFGTTVVWPSVPGELATTTNDGMVHLCQGTPGCIAYVGISAEKLARDAGLQEARLQNRSGSFVKPTPERIAAALASAPAMPADLRGSLIYTAGAGSYPIVNYEYLVVNALQPDRDTALAVRTFLAWAIDPPDHAAAATRLQSVGFVALPTASLPRVRAAIARIGP